MARSYFLPAIVVLLCGVAFGQLNSQTIVELDESKLSFHLLPETRLDFALRNNSDHQQRGAVRLEMLDSDLSGKVQATQVYPFELTPGTTGHRAF